MNSETIFYDRFEPELLEEIATLGVPKSIKEGEVILQYGEIIRMIPIILTGTVKVTRLDADGNELLLYYVNPLESCAMTFTCCMEQFPSEIRAVAETDVHMQAIPVEVMDKWLVKYPTWKSFVMTTIRRRFNELLKTIDQIAFQRLDERLVSYLKEKSKINNSKIINASHENIAADLATSREVISRLLKKLEIEKSYPLPQPVKGDE